MCSDDVAAFVYDALIRKNDAAIVKNDADIKIQHHRGMDDGMHCRHHTDALPI